MPRSVPEVVPSGDTVRTDECYPHADPPTNIRQSYVAETVESDTEDTVCEQAESIDRKRRGQAIEFRSLDRLLGDSGKDFMTKHFQFRQLTEAKKRQPRFHVSGHVTLERSPLRLLLKQYNLLDAICKMSGTDINTSIDIVDAIPPFRPLAESLIWMVESTPRPWLALLKSIRDLDTDVLHDFLNMLNRAVEYTYQILQHTLEKPAVSSKEKLLLNKSHFDHIKVRGYVLSKLQAATTKLIDGLSSSPGGPTPLRYLASSRQLLKGGTGGMPSGLNRALSQDRAIQESNIFKTQRNTSTTIQKLGKPPSGGRLTQVSAFEHRNGLMFLQYCSLKNAPGLISAIESLGSAGYLLPSPDQGSLSKVLQSQHTKISLSHSGVKLPLRILLLRKVNLIACGNPSNFLLSNIYRSIQKLLNGNIRIALPLEVHWKSNSQQKSADGSRLFLKPFPGSWQCRSGIIFWKAPGGDESSLLPAKEFPLSAIHGTILDELITIHLYKCPTWLIPLESSRVTDSETLHSIESRKIFWDLCKYLLKLTELFVFLDVTVNHYYFSLCRQAAAHICRAFHRLSKPLKLNEELHLLRCVSSHFVFLVLVIDCLYRGLDPFALAQLASAEFFQRFVRFTNSLKRPILKHSAKFRGKSSGRRLIAAEARLTTTPDEMPHRQNLGFVDKAGFALCRTLQAVGLSAPAVEPGKRRVKWTCRCGREMYDDYRELRPGAAREFEEFLNGNMRHRPSNIQREHTASAKVVDCIYPASRSEHPTNTFTGSSTSNSSQAYDPRPGYNQAVFTTIQCDPEGRWLLVCSQAKKRPTSLSQINICSVASDKELFGQLKRSYTSLRGKWPGLLSLRTIKSIRFVQFELHFKDFVDIRKVPDMPPETKKDEYQYQPCDLIPPVGENLMAHLFHHPEDANEISVTCLRTPKKRKTRLAVCPQMGTNVGWGIHLVEGWAMTRVWLLALSTFVVGSLVFGICWSILKHDVQGAFGVSAYIVALSALVTGTVQAYFA